MHDVRIAYRQDTRPSWKGSIPGQSFEDFEIPSALTLENASYYPFLNFTGQELRERRLSVQVRCQGEVQKYQLYDGRFRVGGFFSTSSGSSEIGSFGVNGNLGLRLTCSAFATRQLLFDLRPGIYRIPPSTDVKLELVVSRLIAGGINFANPSVFAEVFDSCEGPLSRPTQSLAATIPAASNFSMQINPYCRWLDFQAAGNSIGLAASPILSAYANIASSPLPVGPLIYRNYVAQTWFPTGEPVELGGAASNDMDSTPAVTYTFGNAGTATATVLATQFLEW